MARARKKAKAAGRPMEPDSLRQAGARFGMRIDADELARYEELAGEEGLSSVVRRLLKKWAFEQARR